MNPNVVKGLLLVVGVGLGALITNNFTSKNYLNGRLSACTDITTTINNQVPIGLVCFIENGEVLISSKLDSRIKFTLDGRQIGGGEEN